MNHSALWGWGRRKGVFRPLEVGPLYKLPGTPGTPI